MKYKIEFARQGNFIFGLLMIHFIFFGYLANIYQKSIGIRVLFLYQVIFTPLGIASMFILAAIIFFMVFRENFYEYGIRNSIWVIPFMIIMSWVWYWFIIEEFDWTLIGWYWIRIETYITILTLFGINLLTAIVAAIAKEKYTRYIKKIKEID